MKSFARRALIVLGALLTFAFIDTGIVGKERLRRNGDVVYLALAPVDPRSLVQGDYMALRFALASDIERRDAAVLRVESEGQTAFVAVTLDERRIASLAADSAPASTKLRYRIRNDRVWLGTNAFFFEEGQSERFRAARYGEFRVDRTTGEAMLVGLRDETLRAL